MAEPVQAADVCQSLVLRPTGLDDEVTTLATLPSHGGSLSFVNQRDHAHTRSRPVVVRSDERLELAVEGGYWGWERVARSRDQDCIVGALDSLVEGGARELLIVTSGDGGATWAQCTSIQKPHYMAQLHELRVTDCRRFDVDVHMDDCAGCSAARGLYTYETTDGGRTWSPPSVRPYGVLTEERAGPETTYAPAVFIDRASAFATSIERID